MDNAVVIGADKIIGAPIVAPHAGDLLHEFVLALNGGVRLGKIANLIHAYPTFAELAAKPATTTSRRG